MKKSLIENRIAFLALGETQLLPSDIQTTIRELEDATQQFIAERRLGF